MSALPYPAPATPTHGPATRLAYAFVAVLVGITAGLSSALVIVNTLQLQQILNLSAHQVAWLSTCYVMSAVSANLLLIKVRQQYGLRRFALAFLSLHAVLALILVFVPGFEALLGVALVVAAWYLPASSTVDLLRPPG